MHAEDDDDEEICKNEDDDDGGKITNQTQGKMRLPYGRGKRDSVSRKTHDPGIMYYELIN